MKYVAYYRVSTSRQGRSGLGLEAQKAAVGSFVGERGRVVASFVETESGKSDNRPELAAAISAAKKCGAVLLIAKIDRLARNVAFIANLLEAGVEVTAADMPEANRFVLHIMAAVAEHEGRAISERTKAALKAAKARGQNLGWSMPSRKKEQLAASSAGRWTQQKQADAHARIFGPMIEDMRRAGKSFRAIALEMNGLGYTSSRKGKWHASSIRNTLRRSEFLCSAK